MANSNEDLELLEFTFSRREFKQGERIYAIDREAYGEVIDRHPFVPDVWMVNLEMKSGRKSNTSIHRDKIKKCPPS